MLELPEPPAATEPEEEGLAQAKNHASLPTTPAPLPPVPGLYVHQTWHPAATNPESSPNHPNLLLPY